MPLVTFALVTTAINTEVHSKKVIEFSDGTYNSTSPKFGIRELEKFCLPKKNNDQNFYPYNIVSFALPLNQNARLETIASKIHSLFKKNNSKPINPYDEKSWGKRG